MEHANTGANYVILTKRIKLQHEKNPASYLKIMQNVDFELFKCRCFYEI